MPDSSANQRALSGFVASIEQAPGSEREKLRQAARWVESLLVEGLVELAFSDQPHKTQWTLTVRPTRSPAALAVVFNDGPASIGLWRSVFERLAPNAMARLEQAIAPRRLGQGNAVRDFSDELFGALTDAYREAANTDGPSSHARPTVVAAGGRIDARQFLQSVEGEVIYTVSRRQPNRVLGLQGDTVLVGTTKTPGGEAVPLADVQSALDRLTSGEEVPVNVDSLGYRSAFVGAVLQAVPDARVIAGTPSRITLKPEAVPEEDVRADGWSLEPGESIRRVELHDRYGGSRQGGTIPSRSTPNIMLFKDPLVGQAHGYYDGWVGNHYYYTGHGQTGDQEFKAGNAAVRDHKSGERALRVFRGVGGTVTYLGRFELDDEAPFFRMEAPDSVTGDPRQVIVFRLRPVGDVLRDSQDDLVLPDGISASEIDISVSGAGTAPVLTEVPVENQFVEQVTVSRTATSLEIERREQTLVLAYKAYLEAKGLEVARLRIHPPSEARPIICDVYEKSRNNIVEAKGTGSRGEIRMAIGQVLDYSRFVDPPPSRGVLLPARPRPDLEALLAAASIAAVWPEDDGFSDNAVGRFT